MCFCMFAGQGFVEILVFDLDEWIDSYWLILFSQS